MRRRVTVTVDDLQGLPRGAFLVCVRCGAEYSADYADYSWHPPRRDERFRCECPGKPFMRLAMRGGMRLL